ncbi:TetR/AcrR family transcriptional regulator [Actinomadura flavalba]|uniref:TetR/AcrR family transcriptional regulator n=1 Tax=Actinomadura flavalba TaxID=1120938 RepID=UPI000382F1DD|nr:TetR/AcrR family transcriptional regulator [Actinomadura flavalba]
MGEGTELPRSVELAWGLRPAPGKGPARTLALGDIVAAGLRVGESDGLAAVSMGRVAREVGVSTMALYRYVESKNELLALMADAAVGPPPADLPDPGTDWRAGLEAWTRALRASAASMAWLLRVPIGGPPIMPNAVAWMETGMRAMRGMGVDAATRLGVLVLVNGFVRTQVSLESDLADAAAAVAAQGGVAAPDGGLGALLTRLDAAAYPELASVIASGVLQQEGFSADTDADFEFGLGVLMDGLEALVARGR